MSARPRRVSLTAAVIALALGPCLVPVAAAPAAAQPAPAVSSPTRDRVGARQVAPAGAAHDVATAPRGGSRGAATPGRPDQAAAGAVLSVHLEQLSPLIATPGQDVKVIVRVTNSGAQPTDQPVRVRLRLGARDALLTRTQVRRFAAEGTTAGRIVATARTPQALASQAETQVELTVPGSALRGLRPYGVLPLQAEVDVLPAESASGSPASSVRAVRASYLPYQGRKEYRPLEVSVVVPLTLDPDPSLVNATGADRAQAWGAAIGEDSRIDRILEATSPYPVTWAVDPALIDATTPTITAPTATGAAPGAPTSPTSGSAPGASSAASPTRAASTPNAPATAAPTPAAPTGAATPTPTTPAPTSPATPVTPTSTPTSTPTPTASTPTAPSDPSVPIRSELAGRLAQVPAGRLWSLPRHDPDLSALIAGGTPDTDLRRLLADSEDVGALLQTPGVPRVAWPVGTPLGPNATAQVSAAFGAGGPAALVAPVSAYDSDPDVTRTATRRTAAGTPVVTVDDEMSQLFALSQDPDLRTELSLRMLAESVALLAESPGRQRHVVIAAGRDFDPDPATTEGLLTALAGTPWVHLVDGAQLTDPATTRIEAGVPGSDARDPLSPGPSPVTAAALARMRSDLRDVVGLAGVLSATPSSGIVPDTSTMDALTSSRWRWAPSLWRSLDSEIAARVETLTTGVSVVPSTINFFAEHGILQVTVVNELDVEVHDVRVVFEPQGRPPRLRVTSTPEPLTIRPGSRTTVRVQVEAVAAGVVTVATHLATPTNTRLGTDATVRVRVQPTNGWLMLALGGLAGVVFLAGLYRAVRAGGPRVSRQNLKEWSKT